MSEISVIIPIYNSESFISKCIDSILDQTCQDFELLLINDGSTDNTINIINQYKDKRIKLYNQENKGTGAARNLGLKYATSNYIVFVDSDDTIESNFLQKMLKLCKENNADIVSCVYTRNTDKVKIEILDNLKAFKYLISLPEKIPMSVVGKLFKKDVINELKFDEKNKFEDIEFATKAFLQANKVVYINNDLYKCSYNDNSRSKFYQSNDRIIACFKALESVKEQYPFWEADYVTYALFNSIAIANMMILNKDYNEKLLQEIKDVVKENIKYVKKSQYCFMKKLQIYLFYYNFNFYKIFYKSLKK